MRKSIVKVGYFPITEVEGAETYGAIKWLESEKSGGRAYSAAPKGELSEVYADGRVVYSEETNDGYDISLTLIDLIDDIAEDWLGRTVTETGVAEYANANTPKFGLAIAESTSDGVGEITIYYNCKVNARPTKAGATTEGSFAAQYTEFAIGARPRAKDMLVKYEIAGNELITEVPEPAEEGTEG